MNDKTSFVKRRGLTKTHAIIDYNIWQWKTSIEKSKNNRVFKKDIQKFALQAYKEAGIDNFKASDGWYRRWRTRWKHLNTNETKVLDEIIEPKRKGPALLTDKKTAIENSNYKNKTSILSSKRKKATEIHNKILSPVSTIVSNNYLNTKLHSELVKVDSRCLAHNGANENISNERVSNFTDNSKQNNGPILKKSTDSSRNDGLGLLNQVSPSETIEYCTIDTDPLTQDINLVQKCNLKSISDDESNLCNINDVEKRTSPDSLIVKHVDVDKCISLKTSNTMPQVQLPKSKEVERIPEACTSKSSFSKTPLNLNEDELDMEDHDLFCHSCEDFHPKPKGQSTRCEHTNSNNSLLSCVIEKRETNSKVNPLKKQINVNLNRNKCNDLQVPEPRLKNSCTVKPKGKRYLSQFKSEVVNYALENNLKKAADKFKVNRGTVSEWLGEKKRQRESFEETAKKSSLSDDMDFLKWLEDSKFNLTNELLKQQTTEWLLSSKSDNTSCLWLKMYAHRLNGTEDVSIKKRYIVYPPAFKRVVVFFAETHSNIMASRVFSVARRRILEWQLNGGEGKNVARDSLPCNLSDVAVDKEVFDWFIKQKVPPNTSQVRKKALELYRKAGNLKIECKAQWYYRWRARHNLPPASKQGTPEYEVKLLCWVLTQLDRNKIVSHAALTAKATALGYPLVARGWSFRFCKKHKMLLVATPDPSTPLPAVLEQQILEYRLFVRHIVTFRNLTPSHIVAMDEIPIQFLPKDIRKKTGLVRRTGFESCQASLIVSCLSDGTLLPTLLVFKVLLPTCELKSTVISCASENGHINNDIMNLWLNKVLFTHLDNPEIGGLLISDCYETHTTETVLDALEKHNITQAVIPGGCAFKLMPNLNLCLMFKSMLDQMCQLSLSNQTETLKPPSADQLYLWADKIHRHLAKDQKEMIKTAFDQKLLY